MKIIELQYLPQPGYFALLLIEPALKIDRYEHYIKQTFRNRCRIMTANGIDELSVPVLAGRKKMAIKDIRIDHSQKWLNRNLRAIQSAYGNAPFFEYYAEDLFAVYQKRHVFLFDLMLELLTQCLHYLKFDRELKFTNTYYDLENRPQDDLRSIINLKSNSGITNTYNQIAYQQVFGNDFVNNLSVIDLIFCEGPQAGEIIKSGIKKGTL
jgi:hypothetical protein